MQHSSFIGNIGKFSIYESNGVGKSGNTVGKSKSIQVREYLPGGDYFLKKTVSYKLDKVGAKEEALEKAKSFANENQ